MPDGKAVKITVEAYRRGVLALHGSHLQLFCLLFGPRLWSEIQTEMAAALDPWSPIGYGLFLRDRLNQLLGQAPEFVTVLEQPNGLETALDFFCQVAESELNRQVSRDELQDSQVQMASMLGQMKAELAEVKGDGKAPLGEELEVDIETIAREPWRMQKAIPLRALGLGAREVKNLETALGVSLSATEGLHAAEYTQTILPTLLQMAVRPEAVERPPLTASSRVWKWAGISFPKKGTQDPEDQGIGLAMGAVANLMRKMGTLEGRKEVMGYVLGRQLRHEYGLGKGRGHEEVSLEADGEIQAGIAGYPEAEARLDLETLLEQAPPKQRQALEIYLESARTGRTVESLARERDLSPVTVRNNYKAFIDKHRH